MLKTVNSQSLMTLTHTFLLYPENIFHKAVDNLCAGKNGCFVVVSILIFLQQLHKE